MRCRRQAGRRRPAERGSVTIVAAAVLGVVAVLALGTADLVRSLAAVGRAQTAADAAALAAARDLAVPIGEEPEAAAVAFAGRNGARLLSCACATGTGAVVVVVEVALHLATLGDRVVRARARAVVEGWPVSPNLPERGT